MVDFAKKKFEKSCKCIFFGGRSSFVIFKLDFILILAKVDFILKKKSYKKDVFVVFGSNNLKIVFSLPIKVKTLIYKFAKYYLEFLASKNLSKAFSITLISIRSKT